MKTPSLARLAVLAALLLHSAPQAFGFGVGSNAFVNATSANDGSLTSSDTNLTAFTSEVGEPGHNPNGSGGALKTAWWTYTPAESGFLTVDTQQTSTTTNGVYDTLLSIYTGASINNLIRIASNDDYGNGNIESQTNLSQISFYVQAGTQYRIAVDGYENSSISATRYSVVLSIRLLRLRTLARAGILTLGDTADKVGRINYLTTPTGSFSGKVTLGGKVTAIKGIFTHDGYATVVIPRPVAKGATPLLPYTIIIDGALGGYAYLYSDELTGQSNRLYDEVTYTKNNPHPLAGYYTGVADFSSHAAYGRITATVKSTGSITGTFTAIDGTVVTYSSPPYIANANVTGISTLLIYNSLFANQGYLSGILNITESGLYDNFSGTLIYRRPAAKPGVLFYPAGFYDIVGVQAGTYNKPSTNERALSFLNGVNGVGNLLLTDEGGELGGNISESLSFSVTNKFLFNSLLRKPVLTLNSATGLVSGSITAPPLKKRSISGVLYRYNGGVSLRGYVTGTAKNLEMTVVP